MKKRRWRDPFRNEKDRRKAAAARDARRDAIARAHHLLAPVLAIVNASDGGDAKRAARAAAILIGERGPTISVTPGEQEVLDAVDAARRALMKWNPRTAADRICRVRIAGTRYSVTKSWGIAIVEDGVTGSAGDLAVLNVGIAHETLRNEVWDKCVKRCATPTCAKWFFDATAGTRGHCCAECGNNHQGRKKAKHYKDIVNAIKAGTIKPKPCARPGCRWNSIGKHRR